VIDSTGLKVFGAGDWLHEKHGGKPRRSWRKLHLAVDPESGEILASELTTMEEGDAGGTGSRLQTSSGTRLPAWRAAPSAPWKITCERAAALKPSARRAEIAGMETAPDGFGDDAGSLRDEGPDLT
jgi:hypothetical protein